MKDTLDLNYLLTDFEEYTKTKLELKEIINKTPEERHKICKVSFHDKTYSMNYGKLLLNLYFLEFYAKYNLDFDESAMILDEFYDSKITSRLLDKLLDVCDDNNINIRYYEDFVYDLLNELEDLSSTFLSTTGSELCLDDLLKLEQEEELKPVFNIDIKRGTSYNDIESQFNKNSKLLQKYFHNHKEAGLSPFVTADSGINMKQLTQCISMVGLKPDIDDKTIPVPIKDNYLSGLGNLEFFFINAKGTRKALITNYTMVRKSGYLTRKLTLSTADTMLDDVDDCGTKHVIEYHVDNERKLNMIEGRHYYDYISEIHDENDKCIDYSTLKTVRGSDKSLIGKTIALRDPVKCACKNGHVCHTCYGHRMSEINKNKHIGILAALTLTDPLTQQLLSAKHLLQTNNDKIEWGSIIDENFIIDMNLLFFSNEDVTITIPGIVYENYNEEDNVFTITKFKIRVNGEVETYTSPVTLYINPKFNAEIIRDITTNKECNLEIGFDELGTDEFIFRFEDTNKAISKSLMNITNILETRNHLGIEDIDTFINKFYSIIISNNMDYTVRGVNLSILTRALILDQNNERIDWSKDDIPPYTIHRVSGALMKGPLAKSLVFERIRQQLTDIETYEKDEDSIYNIVFN